MMMIRLQPLTVAFQPLMMPFRSLMGLFQSLVMKLLPLVRILHSPSMALRPLSMTRLTQKVVSRTAAVCPGLARAGASSQR